ncbi:MAG: HAMP domain-containing sensor histidine kinase [Limisphaerales bacterium]
MNDKHTRKVTAFPARLLAVALIMTSVVLVAFVRFTFGSYRNVTTGQRQNLRIQELRGDIVHLDEVLTMSARMAAATGDLNWEQRYRQFEPQLDAAINEAVALTIHSESAAASVQTDAANLALVEMENRSFALVRAGKAAEAQKILFADAYEAQKKIYAGGMAVLIQHLNEQLTANQREKQTEAIFSIVAVAACIVLLFFTWLTILRRLKRTHDNLLEISRKAGMAEVATAILHNVGNVLNSVNVASSCVADNIRKSKSANLSKVVVLLRENEADLGAFLTGDPKGRQIPGYLAQLAEHLSAEQAATLKELSGLQKNIEHIKDIVIMQQSFAKTSGASESLSMAALVEDALKMNASAFAHHDIRVIREFQKVPLITAEKHKMLQILVNLINNARQACDEAKPAEKKLTIIVSKENAGVSIAVTDNGNGIRPENIHRIFAHGFTTKKDGHGFGLHSSALAAKEMGGSLTAHSDGPGLGATFVLELPFQPG